MILSAVGYERGPPTHILHCPFKAREIFAAIDSMVSNFVPQRTAFLVAYEMGADGALIEVEELAQK